ncbi:uncharacterized protein M8220_000162 [Acridotheres tristis]
MQRRAPYPWHTHPGEHGHSSVAGWKWAGKGALRNSSNMLLLTLSHFNPWLKMKVSENPSMSPEYCRRKTVLLKMTCQAGRIRDGSWSSWQFLGSFTSEAQGSMRGACPLGQHQQD